MTEQKLAELLRHAYQWGRDNGLNRSEKNFNDFLQTEDVKQALSIADVVESVCDHSWINIGMSVQGRSLMVCTKCRETKQAVC